MRVLWAIFLLDYRERGMRGGKGRTIVMRSGPSEKADWEETRRVLVGGVWALGRRGAGGIRAAHLNEEKKRKSLGEESNRMGPERIGIADLPVPSCFKVEEKDSLLPLNVLQKEGYKSIALAKGKGRRSVKRGTRKKGGSQKSVEQSLRALAGKSKDRETSKSEKQGRRLR